MQLKVRCSQQYMENCNTCINLLQNVTLSAGTSHREDTALDKVRQQQAQALQK
jgi:hypothetical protein